MMLKRLIVLHTIFCLLALSLSGQTKKQNRKIKPKPIRATVTVKGGLPEKRVNEATEGVWNTFRLERDKIEILFPAMTKDVFEDEVREVRTYQVSTDRATYQLIIRKFETLLDNRQLESFFEEIIQSQESSSSKIVSKRSVLYGGTIGSEMIFEDEKFRSFGRLFVLNGKLIALSVHLKKANYDKSFDQWVTKFFESFRMKIPITNVS